MALTQRHSSAFGESIIHHNGPLLRSRGTKDENLGAQNMSTDNMDPFEEPLSEHHFSL